jgi:hypothetical protein
MQLTNVLIGVIVGGVISFAVQRLEAQRTGRLSRTHRLYESWQSADTLALRVKADEVLCRNLVSPNPLGFVALTDPNSHESIADRIAVSRVLHFFEECGALLDTKAIDLKLYRRLFERYVIYWVDKHLKPLYELSTNGGNEIQLGWYPRVELLRSAVEN